MKDAWDVIVLGAGILGLAIAREVKRKHPDSRVLVIEKESTIGKHGSGRNSGVLHSGIYYPESSLKAKICADGARRMAEYCQDRKLPINRIGKVIVPVREEDDPQVDFLLKRGYSNQAKVEIIDQQQLHQLEPEARSASGRALYSPNTAVIDPKSVLYKIHDELVSKGVKFLFSTRFQDVDFERKEILVSSGERYSYGHVFNAAGQHSDRVAKKFNVGHRFTLVPFRGSYYQLKESSGLRLNHLIYPVPDLNMPFLGIHSVTTIDGKTYFGPSAIPAFGREHYQGIQGIELSGALNTVLNLGQQYISNSQSFRRYTHEEVGRFLKSRFVEAARQLVPRLDPSMLVKSEKVGIRAQLLDLESRKLVMDFLVERVGDSTHVLNAVSPAFTSSFSMAENICNGL